ncbi:hypothetical protein NQ317_007680 [Molorchus minor]|uniref:Rab3 GTPase-activating protein catalytic subunit n=1 Tax=Molorchus minor TaxID=1323400 RepID=A0ABQ9JNJ5_9CUCU|nr:hypothetical protein NQ317_007680 [Molorchus minor]
MNEEIDETEFYHQDFTTASEWEVFIARMEEVVHQWRNEDTQKDTQSDFRNVWDIKKEKITFVDFDFYLCRYRNRHNSPEMPENTDETEKQNKNPIDTLYDFRLFDGNNETEHSCLSTWYGLNEYIVLTPANNMGLTSESKIKILLSSAYIVSSNVNCEMPIFVQIREKWQNCYLGVYEGENLRTNFEMTKIMSPSTIESISVSTQLSYTLTDFGNFIWKQDPLNSDNFDTEILFVLPFGVTVDPLLSITLKATWSCLPDHLIVDTESYSDFDPLTAPRWSCLTKMTNEPVCLLGECLTEFLQNLNNNVTVFDILGDFTTAPAPESNPLDLLTEPAKGNTPYFGDSISAAIVFPFPDADERSNFPYGGKEDKESFDKSNNEDSDDNVLLKNLEEEFKGFKTCGVDSLPWRLSIVLAHSLQSLGGVTALSHIWYEFVQEMRYRWEKSMLIPG